MTGAQGSGAARAGGSTANALALLCLASALSSGALASDPKTGGIDAPALYQRHCAACHGERGDGGSLAQGALAKPPRNFTAPESRTRLTREYMIAIVRDGRPHTPMVARDARLRQDEIEAVVDYIRARFMQDPRAPRPPAN